MGKSKFIKTLKKAKPVRMEYVVNISDGKKKRRFIDQIKRAVRSSIEYRDYIQFLKEHMDMDSCAFFNMVTSNTRNNNENRKVKIEVHHEPLTLDDIVSVVLEKQIQEGQEINALYIAEEVMELHYRNMVGLIPLSKTIHELVHNTDKVPIPLYMCYGAYAEFFKEYEPYISEGIKAKLEHKLELTKSITPESFNAICKEFTYLEVDGRQDDIQKMETSEDALAEVA